MNRCFLGLPSTTGAVGRVVRVQRERRRYRGCAVGRTEKTTPRGQRVPPSRAWSRDAPTFGGLRLPLAFACFATIATAARWRSVPTGCPATSRPTSRFAPGLTDADAGRSKAVGGRCAPSAPSMTAARRSARRATTSRNNGPKKWRSARAHRAETPLSAARSEHRLCTFAHLLPHGPGLQLCSLPGELEPEAMPGRAGPEGGHMTRVVSCSAFRLKPAFLRDRGVHPDRTTRASRPHDPCIQTARQDLCLLSTTF